MHCWHQSSILLIKLSHTEMEANTRHGENLVPAQVKISDISNISDKVNPNMLFRIQVLKWIWSFDSFKTVILKVILKKHSSVKYLLIVPKLFPISQTRRSYFKEHMLVSVTPEWDPCQNYYSTISITVPFSYVGMVVSSVLLQSDALNRSLLSIWTHLWTALKPIAVSSIKRVLLPKINGHFFAVVSVRHILVVLHRDQNSEIVFAMW